MAFNATKIPYQQTGFYSKTIIDYLNNEAGLSPFFKHPVTLDGLKDNLSKRLEYKINRKVLTDVLNAQYEKTETHEAVIRNIELLKKETTFTITTAHQPNIFTGHLYFLYKILHAVKLAEFCKTSFPEYDFVPVYYMGSEDADLEELGHVFINGEKLTWETNQTGAIGRMLVDKNFLRLIERIAGEVGVEAFGHEIMALVTKNYKPEATIQDATFGFVNDLFGKYGLIVLMPDDRKLKSLALEVFKEELLKSTSSEIVEKTGRQLESAGYHPQAYSREINFFYLIDDKRERIEKSEGLWKVVGTAISFNEEQLLQELKNYPERFSPNVILRGVFQEMILPNIAFIGGGGELAYWLQLKDVLEYYKTPFPVLVLRNSFLIIDENNSSLKNRLGFSDSDIFNPLLNLQNQWVRDNTKNDLSVAGDLRSLNELYTQLSNRAAAIDPTLVKHVAHLKKSAEKRVGELEKKMLRAEKRNHEAAMRQVEKLKQRLFPNGNLQERIDNFIPYYAKYGAGFIDELYTNSLSLQQEFVVLEEV